MDPFIILRNCRQQKPIKKEDEAPRLLETQIGQKDGHIQYVRPLVTDQQNLKLSIQDQHFYIQKQIMIQYQLQRMKYLNNNQDELKKRFPNYQDIFSEYHDFHEDQFVPKYVNDRVFNYMT